jgi:uncharacterized membrane-anchored protein
MTCDTRAPGRRIPLNAAFVGLLTTLAGLSASPLSAQDAQDPWADKDSPLHSIEWTDGERQVDIGNIGEFTIPAGCRFADAKGARDFLLMTQNIPSGREQGVLLCRGSAVAEQPWFVVFSFDASGYVRDDEGKKLDAGKILATLREGTARANKVRKAQGWDELIVDGWVRAPYYDPSTHNLTWSVRGHSASDGASVNHSVRLLGRRGVLHADLVAAPEQLEAIIGTFDGVIASTSFFPGQKYSEWRKGDKVAAYGLTALVVGGAGVAAVKLGLFGKIGVFFAKLLAKLGKLIYVALAAVVAGLRSLFRRKREATA